MSDSQLPLSKQSPEHRRALLAKLLDDRIAHARTFPASHGQQALWVIQQLAPETAVYNVSSAIRIKGPLKVPMLRSAIQCVIDRHPSLRTTFNVSASGQPVQTIRDHWIADFVESDASSASWQELLAILANEAHRPFDLESIPPLRVTLFRRSDEEHVLLLVMSHIIVDFWSMSILMQEFLAIYSAQEAGVQAVLPLVKESYKKFVDWETEMAAGPEGETLFQYWKERLDGELPVLKFLSARPRAAVPSDKGSLHTVTIEKGLTKALQRLARAEGTTLFTLLLSAFKVLLYRHTRQEDLLVGAPVAGRNQAQFERIVGYFVNTVTIRTRLTGSLPFRSFLRQTRQTVLDAFAHEDYPFPLLVERLRPNRDGSHSPLFQVMFNLVQPRRIEQPGKARILLGEIGGKLDFCGMELESLSIEQRTAAFDLTLTAVEVDDVISAQWQYATGIFDAAEVAQLAARFNTLLRAIVAEPDGEIASLPLLTEAEKEQLLVASRGPVVDVPTDSCFQTLFEEQVRRTPDRAAVVCGGELLTYRELSAKANRLAWMLARNGVGPESVVGLFQHRGIDFLISILAVFKAGGAYLPLDPLVPAPRTQHVLESSGAPLVLTGAALAPVLSHVLSAIPALKRPQSFTVNELLSAAEREDDLPLVASSRNLAYVIFTSGSTGLPKGVMIEHRGMINHLFAKITDLDLTSADRIAQTASQCFDISVWQFLAALLTGGTTHIYDDDVARNPASLLSHVEHDRISIFESVPSLIGGMLEALEQSGSPKPPLQRLRWLLSTGEDLPPSLCRRWLDRYPSVPLLNAYGPTECSDDVTHHAVRRASEADGLRMPIGRPIANMQTYILDERMDLVPPGIAGELYIGGIGVGRGYLNDPERTAASFVPDRFSSDRDARLYKTGDLSRMLPDGTIEFLGRQDSQVKIRGQRVELSEIELVFAHHPALREVLVMAEKTLHGDHRLVAYLVPGASPAPSVGDLHNFVRTRLPLYMAPSAYVFLHAIPRNSSGKVDHAALPAPDGTRPEVGTVYVAPRNAVEERLAAMWRELLDVDQIGVFDNFFEIGGHSMLAIQLLTRTRSVFSRDIANRLFFANPTIARLADLLTQSPDAKEKERAESFARTANLVGEAVLDETIVPAATSGAGTTAPSHIFVTGATGFLGAHLLVDLLRQTRADVHCLVRARNSHDALEKITTQLRTFGLHHEEVTTRVRIVLGDLAEPRLGLTPAAFQALANEVDAIIHNGANVSFVLPYDALKPANVIGTQEVLRLACQGSPKPVHYISSLAVCSMTGDDGVVREDDDPVGVDQLIGGYAQSKWVAERLVAAAQARGLPVAVYRPGMITGHSETGVSNANDFMAAVLRGCIQLRCAPIVKTSIEMTPVDYVSAAIVQLSCDPNAPRRVFHLSNPHTVEWNDLVRWVSRRGYPVELVPFEEWLARLASLGDDVRNNALYPFLALLSERNAEMRERLSVDFARIELPRYDCSNTLAALERTSVRCPPMDERIFATYLSYLAGNGVPGVVAEGTPSGNR